MNRREVALLALGAIGVGSCSDTNYTIYILRNQKAEPDCVIPPGDAKEFIGFGLLDVTPIVPGTTNRGNIGYIFAPAVRNGTVANKDTPDLHTFFVAGADVILRSNGTAAADQLVAALRSRGTRLDARTQYFSGAISAGGTIGLGFPLIDAEQTLAIAESIGNDEEIQLIAHATIFGKMDDRTVTSDPFDYPITVCRGCLIDELGSCRGLSATNIGTGGVCNPLQDRILGCCDRSTGAKACPAVVEATPDGGVGGDAPPLPVFPDAPLADGPRGDAQPM